MARINRSEWSVNQQMAATPRPVYRARPVRNVLPLSTVARWVGGVVAVVVVLSYVM